MKRKTTSLIVTGLIIIGILITMLLALNKKTPCTNCEIVKCIGSKAVLYTQLGCHACGAQEELFGENYQYLNVIDCWYEREKCTEAIIEYTPTWIINGEKIIGVQTIDELRDLTGC